MRVNGKLEFKAQAVGDVEGYSVLAGRIGNTNTLSLATGCRRVD